jgi:hypothetical protein
MCQVNHGSICWLFLSSLSIYKQWVLNVLEFTTYFNILALAAATFYVLQINGDGTTVALVSIGIQFVLSVCTMTYHIAVETNILGRMKKSGWYQQQFRLELTTHLATSKRDRATGLKSRGYIFRSYNQRLKGLTCAIH